MNQNDIRIRVLLSIQRALLGMIYPSIRAISVGFEQLDKLKVIYYLDREPVDEDYESISELTTEIISDIEFKDVEELCIFSHASISSLDGLNSWVYIRKEN